MTYPHPLTQVHASRVGLERWEVSLLYADGARASSEGWPFDEALYSALEKRPIPPKEEKER